MNLIIEDRNEEASSFVVSYRIKDGVQEPEKALRAAVQDFLTSGTEEAKEAVDYSCGCFNWGDAVVRVPNSYFEKYGIVPDCQCAVDVFVNHDEILYNGEPEETEGD